MAGANLAHGAQVILAFMHSRRFTFQTIPGIGAAHCECKFKISLPCQATTNLILHLTIILTFLCSVSSDGSAESHLVEQEDIIALTQVPFLAGQSWCPILSYLTTQDVRHFKEGLNRLRKVFQSADRDLAAGDFSIALQLDPSFKAITNF